MKKLIIVFFVLIGFTNCKDYNPKKFEATRWKNASPREKGLMASDLVESKILIGKSKAEVLELIGKPKDSSNINFHYLIEFGYMAPFYLDVNFQKNKNKVINVTLAD
ncbi:hypothetical protein [Lacinutrix sp. Bg11-31]|uniref:hypothetical protein n=1 Tax=Lacinutrix sp. Bg11-31 TaxID=2057808 RepID=UPI000C31213B|nr:hypothetical protein [Lacinutrix sp. Bg11-31]AUC83482.1 hypothetical protein CW733_15620 [Lacinutrix sp. Bg11-31]